MEKQSKEVEMVKYVNLARQFPAYFISLIDKQLESFVNDREMPICEDVVYETNEGKSAWKEARRFLESQNALPPFQLHEGLNQAARDHCSDLARNATFGHTGTDKSTFSERILRYCRKGQGAMAEIIGADFVLKDRNNAQMTVLGLIIDDGVADRGHRKTIFNPQYRYIGCKSQVEGDKLITVFNLTENRLELRGRASSINADSVNYGNSTAPCFGKDATNDKVDRNTRTSANFNHPSQHQRTNKQAQDRSAFEQISRNVEPSKSSIDRPSKPQASCKKIAQKRENTKTWHQQGCKIIQKTTIILYSDGSSEQSLQKHTVYS